MGTDKIARAENLLERFPGAYADSLPILLSTLPATTRRVLSVISVLSVLSVVTKPGGYFPAAA
ncbi:hypothetical protein Pr1d_45280 [Bythopirellula goksoeyrii]|uniref:Uncharacterized protein n=1 Tax=Bythopirellula goksoeyrii TaxID=1400387 RepID=A0A5B9QDN7_9BACT|nr:hypothetical protein Pr1d_45280 [Bythopirellula goksoeyrii]